MFTKTTFALAFVLTTASGALAATKQQSAAPRNDVYDARGNYIGSDPDAFYEPWSAVRLYRRVQQPMLEEVCAENNQHLFDYHIPVADKPDF